VARRAFVFAAIAGARLACTNYSEITILITARGLLDLLLQLTAERRLQLQLTKPVLVYVQNEFVQKGSARLCGCLRITNAQPPAPMSHLQCSLPVFASFMDESIPESHLLELALPAPMSRQVSRELCEEPKLITMSAILGDQSPSAKNEACTGMPEALETIVGSHDAVSRLHAVHCLELDGVALEKGWTSSSATNQPEPVHVDTSGAVDIEEYMRIHCKIRAADLKPTALCRIQDLHRLFNQLEARRTVRLARDRFENSVFGFRHIIVNDTCDFNRAVTQMVQEDKGGCWHANGKRLLRQPTSPAYELLRQCGIHPVKGTRGSSTTNTSLHAARNFMTFKEYAFDMERLQRNSSRLKIGVIGNRRQ